MTDYNRIKLRSGVSSIVDGPFGSNLASEHYVDEGARVLRLGNIGSMEFRDDDKAYITLDHYRSLRRHAVEPGDILVAGLGDETHAVGRACIAPADIAPALVKADCFRLRPRRDVFEARYLAWYLNSMDSEYQISLESRGATRVRATPGAILNIGVPSVGLEKQRRIADFLDDQVTRIDNIIAARTAQVNLVQECCTCELTEALFGRHARYLPLSNLAEVRLGRQRSPQSESGNYMTRYLRSANVSDGKFDLTDVKEMNFEPAERAIFTLRSGDVLVTEGAGSPDAVGASAVWDGRENSLCFQNTLVRLRPRSAEIVHDYLGWWARASHRSGAMRTWATGANILHIGAEGLKRMPIPAADLPAQQAVVRRCEKIEVSSSSLVGGLASSIERLVELKRSLITAAVTGEFDVSSADGSQVPA